MRVCVFVFLVYTCVWVRFSLLVLSTNSFYSNQGKLKLCLSRLRGILERRVRLFLTTEMYFFFVELPFLSHTSCEFARDLKSKFFNKLAKIIVTNLDAEIGHLGIHEFLVVMFLVHVRCVLFKSSGRRVGSVAQVCLDLFWLR